MTAGFMPRSSACRAIRRAEDWLAGDGVPWVSGEFRPGHDCCSHCGTHRCQAALCRSGGGRLGTRLRAARPLQRQPLQVTVAPPQRHDVAEHRNGMPPQRKRRTVFPHEIDGNSLERQPQPLRKEHDFRIEGEAVQRQSGEDLACRPQAESLQSALGIGNFVRDQSLDHLAEEPRGERARQLALGLMGRLGQVAGAEDDFALCRCGPGRRPGEAIPVRTADRHR